ncbi:MAG: hypothetical protein AAFY98_08805 [Verrucomicrobiota bacterium]
MIWEGETTESTDQGFVQLIWSSETGNESEYQLQQSSDPDFLKTNIRYQGPDHAFFASGLAEGTHYFRIRTITDGVAGTWSNVKTVEVVYPAKALVLTLMAIGALTLLALITVILKGSFRQPATERSGLHVS